MLVVIKQPHMFVHQIAADDITERYVIFLTIQAVLRRFLTQVDRNLIEIVKMQEICFVPAAFMQFGIKAELIGTVCVLRSSHRELQVIFHLCHKMRPQRSLNVYRVSHEIYRNTTIS